MHLIRSFFPYCIFDELPWKILNIIVTASIRKFTSSCCSILISGIGENGLLTTLKFFAGLMFWKLLSYGPATRHRSSLAPENMDRISSNRSLWFLSTFSRIYLLWYFIRNMDSVAALIESWAYIEFPGIGVHNMKVFLNPEKQMIVSIRNFCFRLTCFFDQSILIFWLWKIERFLIF